MEVEDSLKIFYSTSAFFYTYVKVDASDAIAFRHTQAPYRGLYWSTNPFYDARLFPASIVVGGITPVAEAALW
jgi:hypothetical protein